MSGGFFDYEDMRLDEIAAMLEEEVTMNSGRHSTKTMELFHRTIQELKRLCNTLHHIDYYIECDIGEECMHRRIEEDAK
jgi:hypothetical protein